MKTHLAEIRGSPHWEAYSGSVPLGTSESTLDAAEAIFDFVLDTDELDRPAHVSSRWQRSRRYSV